MLLRGSLLLLLNTLMTANPLTNLENVDHTDGDLLPNREIVVLANVVVVPMFAEGLRPDIGDVFLLCHVVDAHPAFVRDLANDQERH